jgi:hypothetical protein
VEPIPDGLSGRVQELPSGGGQHQPVPPAARPFVHPPQQPGRSQLLKLPGHGGKELVMNMLTKPGAGHSPGAAN